MDSREVSGTLAARQKFPHETCIYTSARLITPYNLASLAAGLSNCISSERADLGPRRNARDLICRAVLNGLRGSLR